MRGCFGIDGPKVEGVVLLWCRVYLRIVNIVPFYVLYSGRSMIGHQIIQRDVRRSAVGYRTVRYGGGQSKIITDGPPAARCGAMSVRCFGDIVYSGNEFTDIPYNDWDCIGLFVVDASNDFSSIVRSWDAKLGIVDFLKVRVSFFSVSYIPPMCCYN